MDNLDFRHCGGLSLLIQEFFRSSFGFIVSSNVAVRELRSPGILIINKVVASTAHITIYSLSADWIQTQFIAKFIEQEISRRKKKRV